MREKITSTVLTLCLLLTLLPTAAWADETAEGVSIGGTTLETGYYVAASDTGTTSGQSAEYRVVDSVSSVPSDGKYLQYNAETHTLTVHGAVELTGASGGIAASGAVTLNTGTRDTDSLTLTMTSGGSALTVNDGGTLTLTGGGALTLSHSGNTPAVYGSVSKTGSLTTSGFTGDIAITSAGNGAVLSLASVDLTTTGTLSLAGNSSSSTVSAAGSVTLKGSSVALTNGTDRLCDGDSVSITSTGNGALSLSGNCSYPLLLAYSGAVTLASGGDLTVANSGGAAVSGRLVIGSGSTGIAGAGAKNVTVSSAGNAPTISNSTEISATGDVTIKNTGTGVAVVNTLSVTSAKNVTVTSAGPNPTIGGAVSINAMVDADTNDVTITNTGSSMAVSGTLNVTNAKNVTVSSKSRAPTIVGNTRIDAAGDVSITNSAYTAVDGTLNVTSSRSFTATGSSTDPIIGGKDHTTNTEKVSVNALNDITIVNSNTSGAAVGIETPSLTSTNGAVFLTSNGTTTVTPHGGTAVTAANGGDVSSRGLNLSTPPEKVTYYKAGSGYIIFTPAVTTGTAAVC